MSQAPQTEETSLASQTSELMQQFQFLQQQQDEQRKQFDSNRESLQKLSENGQKTEKNDESKISELENDLSSKLKIIDNTEIKNSGIDQRTQGDIFIKSPSKNETRNPYESLSIKDFSSMTVKTDPSKPILREELLDGCTKQNFIHPSKIQATAIPICLEKSKNDRFPNLIAQAHHGSGKTATFALIMLSRIDEFNTSLQGLCIVHSRELAIQTFTVVQSLGEFISNLKIALALPGKEPPFPWDCQICIGTPGTIINKYINPLKRKPFDKFLQSFKVLIIDEADEFLKSELKKKTSRGRPSSSSSSYGSLYDQLYRIIKDIQEVKYYQETKIINGVTQIEKVPDFQTLLFSATYPQKVKKLATQIARNAYIIRLEKKQVQLDNIKTFKIICQDEADKFNTLLKVISTSNVGQMIVFVNTVIRAKQLVEALDNKNIGIACSVLYGRGLDIGIRDKTMEQFRKGQTQCLIASNVIARGIDVPAVGLVVNFEIPLDLVRSEKAQKTGKTSDAETFMHRVGRTGRFGNKGVCINLLSKDDLQSNNMLDAIQKEYSLNIIQLNNDLKSIKQNIADWLQ